jgi:prepilin-type N-terminal cleavage/methylation domain-containing protein
MLLPHPDHDPEAGFTLIELLVAIVIMSVAIVGLMGVMASLTLATEHHRGLSSTDAAVRDWGEAIKKKSITAATYKECPSWGDLDPGAAFAFPTGTDASSTDPVIEYWVPVANNPLSGTFSSDQTACENRYKDICGDTTQSGCDSGIQRLTLTAVSTDASTRGGQTTTQIILRRGNTT